MKELVIPDAAVTDEHSREMIRVWIAGGDLHRSINVGTYKDQPNVDEARAWGIILSDVARHVANALFEAEQADPRVVVDQICDSFISEISSPTSKASGNFVRRN
jgi:hypothetical protein